MTLGLLLRALRRCGEVELKIKWDGMGNIIENISMEEHNQRLADKIQKKIEGMYAAALGVDSDYDIVFERD